MDAVGRDDEKVGQTPEPPRGLEQARVGAVGGHRLALRSQEGWAMAIVVDDHRWVALVLVWRDEPLRRAVHPRLEVHRGLRPEAAQNADRLHGTPLGCCTRPSPNSN